MEQNKQATVSIKVQKVGGSCEGWTAKGNPDSRIPHGSRFHAGFKSNANGLVDDRMAFAVVWVAGTDRGSFAKVAYVPGRWELFRIDNIVELQGDDDPRGGAWLVELIEIFGWPFIESTDGLREIYEQDFDGAGY